METTSPRSSPSSRRTFITSTCSALVALGLGTSGLTIVGCDSGGSSPPPLPDGVTLNGNTLTIDLTQFPDLRAPRGALWIANQDVFIIHAENDAYRAFSSVCPHEGEDVTVYEQASAAAYQLRCPAHDWTFDLAGAPTGRAQRALPLYATTKENDTLRITLT